MPRASRLAMLRFVERPRSRSRSKFSAREHSGPIDDPQILGSPALYGGLDDVSLPVDNKIQGIYDHAFSALCRHVVPPAGDFSDGGIVALVARTEKA